VVRSSNGRSTCSASNKTALLSHIVDTGSISIDLAIALADVVFESHQTATRLPGNAGAERVQHLITLVSTTLTTLQGSFDVAEIQCFAERATGEMRQVTAALNARAAAGFVISGAPALISTCRACKHCRCF
jgi:hypothetical protein